MIAVLVAVVSGCEGHARENFSKLALEGSVRVASIDLRSSAQFSLHQANAGTIAILQHANPIVRLYAPEGTHLATFDLRAERRERFERFELARSGWLADTLWLYDSRIGQVLMVNRQGIVTRRLATPRSFGARASSAWQRGYLDLRAILSDGSMIGLVHLDSNANPAASYWVARIAPDGEVMARYATISSKIGYHRWRTSRSSRQVSVPFVPRPRHAVSPNGAYVAVLMPISATRLGSIWEVSLWNADGSPAYTRRVNYPASPLSRPERDGALQTISRWDLESDSRAELMAQVPKFTTRIHGVHVGNDGSLVTELDAGKLRQVVVVNSFGDLVGTTSVRTTARLFDVSAMTLRFAERRRGNIDIIATEIAWPADRVRPNVR